MNVKPGHVASLVKTREDAEAVIANLITRFATDSAQKYVVEEARFAKQSPKEVVRRTATNILRSFRTRRW